MMLGLLLLSVVALAREQWALAAGYMVLGIIVKPTFIIFFPAGRCLAQAALLALAFRSVDCLFNSHVVQRG